MSDFFASWPVPFVGEAAARAHLGTEPVVDAWIEDLEPTSTGLLPRFDADVMGRCIAAVHEPRWREWEALQVPTLAVFARHGMFSAAEKHELVRRRPGTRRVDMVGGSHDAHLDAVDEWIQVLRSWLHDPGAILEAEPSGGGAPWGG